MLAQRGATVGIAARRAERLAEVLYACRPATPPAPTTARAGPRADDGASLDHRMWAVDLSDPAAAARLAEDAWEAFGHLDAVVNNAAQPLRRPVTRLDLDAVEGVMRTNFLSPVALCLAVLPRMLERDRGVIVNVGSLAGRLGAPREAAYAASKYALHGWSEVMAVDLWSTGVEVRLIVPGAIATEIWDQPGNDPSPYDGPFEPPETVAAAICEALTGDGFERYVPDLKAIAELKTADIDTFMRGAVDFVAQAEARERQS
jgi:NAD(P)-dependent dehydrogenase (short-subunit alcohol dehydrogenase family)